jgi:hypothetical protein
MVRLMCPRFRLPSAPPVHQGHKDPPDQQDRKVRRGFREQQARPVLQALLEQPVPLDQREPQVLQVRLDRREPQALLERPDLLE